MKLVALCLAVLTSVARAGTINYEIIDYTSVPSGATFASGQRQQVISDVKTEKREGNGMTLWSKSVLIDKGFRIGFSDAKDKHLTGFGMWVKTDPDAFSWDWFNEAEAGTFVKLKEGGRIKVRTVGAPVFEEIAEIEFLTDVSLRAIQPGGNGRVLKRVNIKKGSILIVLP